MEMIEPGFSILCHEFDATLGNSVASIKMIKKATLVFPSLGHQETSVTFTGFTRLSLLNFEEFWVGQSH